MAPIASLVVRLSAQISEFQKSFAEATTKIEKFGADFAKTAAGIQTQSTGIGGSFSGIVESAAGVAAGMVTAQAAIGAVTAAFSIAQKAIDATFGSIVAAVSHTSDLGDELFTLSQKTGLSVESLSAFKFVAAQTGTSLESITGAVFKLESNLGSGAKKTADALSGIGLSLKQLRSEDPAQAFSEIIAKLGELPNASARAATGVAIFGKSFKDISQLSQENLPELIQQAKDLGVVMSTETAVAADRFNDAMGVIRAGAEGLQLQIGAKLLPAVIAFAETFGTIMTDAFKTAGFGGEKFTEAFDTVVVQVGKGAARIVEIFALLTGAVAQWAADGIARFQDSANAFITLAETILTVTKLVDLAQNGGAGGAAIDAVSKRLEGIRGTINSLASTATSAGSSLAGFSKAIADAASNAGDNFGATYKRIQSEISASADKMRSSLRNIGTGGLEGAAGASDAFKSFGNQLRDLTAQIDRAKQNGTPLAELVRLFGDEAAKATPKAAAWGFAVKASITEVSKAFNQAALDKTLTKLDDQLGKFFDARAQAQFKKLQAQAHETATALLELPKTLTKLDDGFTAFFARRSQDKFDSLSAGLHEQVPQVIAAIHPIEAAFKDLGDKLPGLLFNGLKSGSVSGLLNSFAQGAAEVIGRALEKQIAALKPGEKLTGKAAVGAVALGGLQSFTSGFELGEGLGKKKGALAGAATGAAIGANPALSGSTLGISIAVGAGVGALAGYLGGRAADKKAQAALVENKKALADQFGGMTKLNELASRLGVNIQAAFDAKKPAQFQAAVDKLNAALEAQNKRTEGLAHAMDAVNARAANFSNQFAPLVTAKKTATDSGDTAGASKAGQQIQELAQRTQPEFERISLFVRDTFAGIVKDTGDAIGAITQLAPSFQTLKDGITDFGLTSTGVIDSLLSSFDIVNNDAFKPLFENIQTTGKAFKGLFDAKALSPDTFQAAAADIGQSIQEIVNRGADMAKTIGLSAPQLQTLWEAQKTYGAITDQTTQSILDQAVAQGVVGEQFKSVNEKILDVLLAIGDALHAVIPDGLRGLAAPAEEAGAAVRSSLGGAFDDVAAKVDPTVGESLRGISKPAADAGQAVESSLTGAFDNSARVARDRAIEIGGVVGDAFNGVPRQWDGTVGASLSSLPGMAKTAADGVSAALAKVRAPDINITAKVNVEQPPPVVIHYDYRHDFVPAGSVPVPALAEGGIVRRPTLALIGEAGPEAVVPLSKLAAFATKHTRSDRSSPDVFTGMGSALSGLVSTARTFADQVNRELARILSPTVAVNVRMGALPRMPALTQPSVVPVQSPHVSEARERAYAARPTAEAALADLFSGLGVQPSAAREASSVVPGAERFAAGPSVPWVSMDTARASVWPVSPGVQRSVAVAAVPTHASIVDTIHTLRVAAPHQTAVAGRSPVVQGFAPQMPLREQVGPVARTVDHVLSGLFAGLKAQTVEPAHGQRSVHPIIGEHWTLGAVPKLPSFAPNASVVHVQSVHLSETRERAYAARPIVEAAMADLFSGLVTPPSAARASDVWSGVAPLLTPASMGIPHLATGGIATRRTLAILAESGPEAVIPLHRASIPGPTAGETTVQLWMDGRLMGEVLLPRAAQAAKRFGLVPR